MDTAEMYADFAKRFNKLYLTVKSLTEKAKERDEKILKLEEKLASFESISKNILNTKEDDIEIKMKVCKLENQIESMTSRKSNKSDADMKNVECLKNIHSMHLRLENIESKLVTAPDNDKHCETRGKNLEKEILTVNQKLTNLDKEYSEIKTVINQRNDECDKKIKIVKDMENDLNHFKHQFKSKGNTSKSIMFGCKQCDQNFPSHSDLKCHIKEKHGNKNIVCKKCEEHFDSNWKYECHMSVKHDAEKPFTCEECNKTFHSKWRLTKHMNLHDKTIIKRHCHYYNNKKVCPYESMGCKFLHVESVICFYSSKCKLEKCQFRHV